MYQVICQEDEDGKSCPFLGGGHLHHLSVVAILVKDKRAAIQIPDHCSVTTSSTNALDNLPLK
jgi:hypothetical protein